MRDVRLKQAQALLDDARTLLIDVVDERPADANLKDYNAIDAARQFINSAIPYLQSADDTQETP
jgi:hypothetical protein